MIQIQIINIVNYLILIVHKPCFRTVPEERWILGDTFDTVFNGIVSEQLETVGPSQQMVTLTSFDETDSSG